MAETHLNSPSYRESGPSPETDALHSFSPDIHEVQPLVSESPSEQEQLDISRSIEAPIAAEAGISPPDSKPRPKVRRASSVKRTLRRIYSRRNEFLEILLGPYSLSGWATSLLFHLLLLLLLMSLLIPQSRDSRLGAVTASVADSVGVANLSEVIDDLDDLIVSDIQPQIPETAMFSGGSSGEDRLPLAALIGDSGRGTGTGTAVGDGTGSDIAARVAAAGGQGGKFQVSLAWEDMNDIDLSVQTPDQEAIYYRNPSSHCGGELDIDMNAMDLPRNMLSRQPVENITWPEKIPPDGTYRIRVHFFGQRPGQSARPKFRVRIQVGEQIRVLTGQFRKVQQYIEVARVKIENSQLAELRTLIKTLEPDDEKLPRSDEKRKTTREQFAQQELIKARATTDERLRRGKLRRLIRRFPGTQAAEKAQQLLEEMQN